MENKIKTSEFGLSMENKKDFDITLIDVKTYYDRLIGDICRAIETCEGKEIKSSEMELFSVSNISSQILADGKEYPLVSFIVRKKAIAFGIYRINITPFTMTIDGILSCDKGYKRQLMIKVLAKAVKNFHAEIFGDEFKKAFNDYHQFVKDIRIKAIENEKNQELIEIESMYRSLM